MGDPGQDILEKICHSPKVFPCTVVGTKNTAANEKCFYVVFTVVTLVMSN